MLRTMKLSSILPHNQALQVEGSPDVHITGLAFDSRKVSKGSVFFAIRGIQSDGHSYIQSAVQGGAAAIICEELPQSISPSAVYIKVANSAYTLGDMAALYYGDPSRKLKLVGITGTNGKTTTVTLLWRLMNNMGGKAGLISTVKNCIGTKELPSSYTTPDALELNQLLASMVDEGCTHCFMEVSSHALVQGRVQGLTFAGGIFSNITHDHLDYHKTFEEYIRAKKLFFDGLGKEAFALVNIDDRNGRIMVQNTLAKVKSYSLRAMADYKCRIVEHQLDGMMLIIDGLEMWTRLIGGFNAYNLLAVYATARQLGFDKQDVLTALSGMEPVTGRFEHTVSGKGVVAIVDYAHTPDALSNVIDTINSIKPNGKRLITVVGAGGNRDRTKRPVMAQVAIQGSELVVLTSDNPRFEEPEDILNDMRAGVDAHSVGKLLVIADRREAIRTAALLASEGDFVLIAGKGHETYQEVKGVRHHFDDKEEVEKAFKQT